MKKQNICCAIFLMLISLFSVFTGCENRDEVNSTDNQNVIFDIATKFVRLENDSTNMAGVLEITSNIPEIELKWNVLPKCNIDTSLTSVPVKGGSCSIPIKWRELTDSVNYAPQSIAFNGGVLVTAGELSKYVPIVWADEVDSVKLCNTASVQTRANEALPKAEMLELTPRETLNMQKVNGGAFFVDFSGMSAVFIDATEIQESTNIDVSQISPIIRTPTIIDLKWDPEAPEINFSTRVTCSGGSISKTLNINYIVPFEEPLIWEFINSSTTDGNDLPATNATVSIMVKTNKPWSIESTTAEISPVPDYGTGIGIKTLTLHIKDNPGPDPRPVSVLVKSEGVLKEALSFTQLAPNSAEKALVFISSDPEHGATILSGGTTATVKVKTNVAWWIDLNGNKTNFPAGEMGEKIGTINIPTSTSTSNQIVSYMVGYDNTIVKTISYIQPAQGSDIGGTLEYESSNLPTGNIPSDGGTFIFTFSGSYTGNVQVRALLDGIAQTPGSAVTNKQPQVTIPANTGAMRNVSFQYKMADGNWIALPTSTNKIQDAGTSGGETLNYVSSNLPAGNIPATVTVYTFNFEGGYAGRLRVRAVDATTGTVLFNGPIGTTHSPKATVPANTDTTPRNIKFQYRLIDVENSPWEDLPTSTNRTQDGASSEAIIPSATLSPGGDVPEEGGTYTCTFTGGSGNVILRAMKKHLNSSTTEAARSAVTAVPGDVSVIVPTLGGVNATISFEYSTDGGNTWIAINDDRNQLNTWLFVDAPPRETIVPATNGSISFGLRGNSTQPVTIYVKYEGREIGRATGYAPGTLVVPVEDNPSSSLRRIAFSYQTVDGEGWIGAELIQAGK